MPLLLERSSHITNQPTKRERERETLHIYKVMYIVHHRPSHRYRESTLNSAYTHTTLTCKFEWRELCLLGIHSFTHSHTHTYRWHIYSFIGRYSTSFVDRFRSPSPHTPHTTPTLTVIKAACGQGASQRCGSSRTVSGRHRGHSIRE